jgi:hypothetical protein
MRFLSDFDKIEGFIKLSEAIKFNEFEVIGYFPYSTATIRSNVKVPRSVYSSIEKELMLKRILDNKIVIICRDLVDFGTDDFAIQFHDSGCRIGGLEDVIGYGGRELKEKI